MPSNFVMACWLVIGKMLSNKGYLIRLVLLPRKCFPIHDAFDITTSNSLISMWFSNLTHQDWNRTSVKHSNAVARLGEPREQSEAACCCSPQSFERRSITETLYLKCELRIGVRSVCLNLLRLARKGVVSLLQKGFETTNVMFQRARTLISG